MKQNTLEFCLCLSLLVPFEGLGMDGCISCPNSRVMCNAMRISFLVCKVANRVENYASKPRLEYNHFQVLRKQKDFPYKMHKFSIIAIKFPKKNVTMFIRC